MRSHWCCVRSQLRRGKIGSADDGAWRSRVAALHTYPTLAMVVVNYCTAASPVVSALRAAAGLGELPPVEGVGPRGGGGAAAEEQDEEDDDEGAVDGAAAAAGEGDGEGEEAEEVGGGAAAVGRGGGGGGRGILRPVSVSGLAKLAEAAEFANGDGEEAEDEEEEGAGAAGGEAARPAESSDFLAGEEAEAQGAAFLLLGSASINARSCLQIQGDYWAFLSCSPTAVSSSWLPQERQTMSCSSQAGAHQRGAPQPARWGPAGPSA